MKVCTLMVSVHYAKKLDYILTSLRHTFDDVFVSTSEDDRDTKEVALKHSCRIFEYNFHTNGAQFDKGGAVRQLQMQAYKEHPGWAHLLLDADSVLPLHWKPTEIENEVLYGVPRMKFKTLTNFILNIGDLDQFSMYANIGFFQLYRSSHVLYQSFPTADKIDTNFASLFSRQARLPFMCKSLGTDSHWNGVIQEDFLWE